MLKHKFIVKAQIIWNKPSAGMGWADYRYKHEPCFYAGTEGESCMFYGDRTGTTIWDFHKTDDQLLELIKKQRAAEENGKSTIWSIKRDNVNEYVHPTQKPVALIENAITNSSKKDDIVMDLFGGSGSTLIACQKRGRIARIMELDPKYVDVIVKRWENYTGLKAEKISQ